MPSFDVVVQANLVEVRNTVEQTQKQIQSRFDFKGTSAAAELKDESITLLADNDFQLEQVRTVLLEKAAKRQLDVRLLKLGKPEKLGGDKLKLVVEVRSGIESELAKKITTAVKTAKLKVQAAIQGEVVRVSGAKRDELQAVIALLRKEFSDEPLAFENFRD